ncbi:MAG: CpaF family protein [Candidatus Omnitrophica bacterium]|nr:CpaF family protein [Candidatus Omnitrophota bacterium]
METNKQIELESALVERLYGKFYVMQDVAEKRSLVEQEIAGLFQEDNEGRFKDEKEALSNENARLKFVEEFLSYGAIQEFLADFECEDIIINALKPIYIHHSNKGLIRTDKQLKTKEEMALFINKLVLFSGRKKVEKIMNIELPNLEGRVNLVKSPFGPQLTITKAKGEPLSILSLVERGALTYEVAAQLWLYLEGMSIRPANILLAGGPGVGKTTLLNALFSFIPEGDRLVVIEDTLELSTEFEESCSRLESGEDFTLADLVKNSLRMRPERIVIGEVRGAEARDMMTAANVGKYCIGTIHALSAREAIVRLQNEPMHIPEDMIRLIDVFIVLKRYHVEDKIFRVVDEVSETGGMEQQKILLSQIYKYNYESRSIRPVSTSTVYRDRLAQQAGLTPKDIILEVQLRAFLLQQMAERGHMTLREVTSFCWAYNKNPNKAVASMGFDRKSLLGKGQ